MKLRWLHQGMLGRTGEKKNERGPFAAAIRQRTDTAFILSRKIVHTAMVNQFFFFGVGIVLCSFLQVV